MKKSSWIVSIGVAIFLVVAMIVAFQRNLFPKNDSTIRVGVIIHMTGEAASLGVPLKNGFLLAETTVNSQGGVNGKRLQLIIEDSKNTVKGTVMAYNKLLSQNVSAIITTGDIEYRAINACLNNGGRIPVIGTACTGGISENRSSLLYRYCYSEESQDIDLVKFVISGLGRKKMSILYPNNLYGQDIIKYTKRGFEELGGTIVGSYPYDESSTGQKDTVVKVLKDAPEVVCLRGIGIGFESIIKTLRELGFKGPIVGDITLGLPDTIRNNTTALEDCFYVAADVDRESTNEVIVDYLSKYKTRFNVEGSFWDALSYDSCMVVVEAIRESNGKPLQSVLDHLKPIQGVLGAFSFNKNREIDFRTSVYVIRNGNSVLFKK